MLVYYLIHHNVHFHFHLLFSFITLRSNKKVQRTAKQTYTQQCLKLFKVDDFFWFLSKMLKTAEAVFDNETITSNAYWFNSSYYKLYQICFIFPIFSERSPCTFVFFFGVVFFFHNLLCKTRPAPAYPELNMIHL